MRTNKVRYLQITFSEPIMSWEIPYFRAAVIERTKRESDLFHNHIDDKEYVYRYPLIQYKIKDKKPSLICLKEATEDIHYLLRQKNFNFRIGNKQINFDIDDVRLKYELIQTWNDEMHYNIHHWLALNQENFQIYQAKETIVDKYAFLQELLAKHLMIFAEAMDAAMIHPLQVKITRIESEKYIEYKGVFHLTFNLDFKTNLSIPLDVGIGKGVSIGFGIVKRLHSDRPHHKKSKYEESLH